MDLTFALKVIPGSRALSRGFPIIREQSQEGGKQINHVTYLRYLVLVGWFVGLGGFGGALLWYGAPHQRRSPHT